MTCIVKQMLVVSVLLSASWLEAVEARLPNSVHTFADDRSWADRLEYIGVAVEEPGYHVWGSSPVIGPEGKTHLFVSRWPISSGFGGWLTDCEIARYAGNSPEGPFVFQEVVVKGTGQDTWDHQSPHNPNVQKVGNRYVLLYIANAGGEKKAQVASQRIGMMIADAPEGPWGKAGTDGLILAPPDDPAVWSHSSTVGVNNPALLPHADGRFYLYYKAKKKGDVRRMGVAIANRVEGPYVFHKEYLTGNNTEIEDGYAFVENGKIRLITTHNSAGAGYLWESDDGLKFGVPVTGFDPMDHYLPQSVLQGAKVLRGKKFERPQVLIQNGQPAYLYVASGVNLTGGSGSHSCVLRIRPPQASPDPLEASVRAKADRPWFAQYMVGEPIVEGFPGESEADRLKRIQPWEDARFGLFLHWGPQKKGGEAVIPDKVLSKFNPVQFDADEWVLTAKQLGFRYIVITSKHHAGFCMFDSAYTDHDIMDATPFGRDPLKELADACAKHDMLLGFYYSVWDIKHPDYTGDIGSPNYARYHQYMLDQTEELLTKYGSVATLWLDGEWANSWTVERAADYRDHIRALQPEIMLVDRIGQRRVGDGDYGSSENFVPYIGDNWTRPWESCQKFDGGWFWKGKDTSQSLDWAMRNLFDAVSRGGNFLMNMGPTPEGLLPPISVKKLKPMGEWLQANGECVYGTQRGPHYLLDWGTCTRRGNTLYYQVFDWPDNGSLIIPGLNGNKPDAGIQQLVVLNHEVPVPFKQINGDVHVQLPLKPVDPLLTVLKVELDGEPVVNNAIRPLGKPLRPQIGNPKTQAGDYYLSSAFAAIHGDSLHFSLGSGAGAQRENLKGWMNTADYPEWTLRVEEAGIYEIKVNYYSWMKSGRFVVEVAGQSFSHNVRAGTLRGKKSPLKAGAVSTSLGSVQFDEPGTCQLTVRALEIAPEALEIEHGLMGLKNLILTKVK